MITSNLIQRVFHIKFENKTGTCFFIDLNSKQYFLTARHIFQDEDNTPLFAEAEVKSKGIFFMQKGQWVKVTTLKSVHSNISDVSVFHIEEVLFAHPVSPSMDGAMYGQDLYFLGFPYGIYSNVDLNNNFPLPFVKKAILSAMFFDKPEKSFFIDGINNIGFSGGPVIFKKGNSNEFGILGVVSAYFPEKKLVEGKVVNIEGSNTGIIVCYSIDVVIELIKTNFESQQANILPLQKQGN